MTGVPVISYTLRLIIKYASPFSRIVPEQLKFKCSVCGDSEPRCAEEGEAGGALRPVDAARRSHNLVQQAIDGRDEVRLL